MSKIYIKHITEVINQRISLSAYCLSTQKNDAHERFIMPHVSMEAKKFCEIKWMMYVCRMNVTVLSYLFLSYSWGLQCLAILNTLRYNIFIAILNTLRNNIFIQVLYFSIE